MGEVSEAAKVKAAELANALAVSPPTYTAWYPSDAVPGSRNGDCLSAFAAHIQDVSDAAEWLRDGESLSPASQRIIAPFILPEPTDPLVDIVAEVVEEVARSSASLTNTGFAERFIPALTERGLRIVEAPDA